MMSPVYKSVVITRIDMFAILTDHQDYSTNVCIGGDFNEETRKC